ncbi:MAG TPA: 2-hydroxyacid dehydrogenase [Mycobacteriales bacterium]|nr:2-hydroxyacid dehydrogenase [Mycobacteriales bacterium]
MPTRHLLLSTEQARDLVGPLPPEVRVAVWNGSGEPPTELDRTQFWVPQMLMAAGIDAMLAQLPALEVVQLTTAGADAFIGRLPDSVLLCDGRGVHGGSTSEWVLAVTLAALRELPRFVRAQDERRWDYTFTGELAGKRVLVVGAGDVGGQIRRKLLTFDTAVTMVARRARAATGAEPAVHAVAELPDLLPAADVVVVVVPLTGATRGLVDAAFLAAMPDGALLVNGARGPVVDTAALTAELAAGRLRAAVDVTDPEPLPPDHPLWTVPGLLLTPHVAGSVHGFPARAYRLVREQLDRWLAGEPLINQVVDGY